MPQLRVEQVSLASRSLTPHPKASPPVQYLLRDISFEVNRGDRLSLVGASGCGKTSLLRLLNRLSEPFRGTVYLEGQPFSQVSVVALRQQITLVHQETKLFGMTVREALTYPLKLRNIPPTTSEPKIAEWIEKLQIPQAWLDRTESQLSLGERQWVAIARGLVIQPKILLLDEPTASLDAGRSHHLLKVLLEMSQLGQTIFMANHQLDLAKQFSDRVLHLHQGALIQDRKSTQIDWQALRETIARAEATEAEEWE
ncbi:MAG: ATP-binding cassette domain-containing protein [Leptolyngbyaceae cyanobacterium CSU_1_3]|nr:ATP-binding cassette domain-containing protein [Leptolyngbyaceae cyanobacterium CSU_1_3]